MGLSRIEDILQDTLEGNDYVGPTMSRVEKQLDELNLLLMGQGGGAITEAVNTYLDNHPEATTTVLDGSITRDKLAPSYLQTTLQYSVVSNVDDV